jgi:hypothetical protein
MDSKERECLEKELSEAFEMRVVISDYAPKGRIFLGDMSKNPYWDHSKGNKWLVLPVDVASTPNVSEAVKNAILKRMPTEEMTQKDRRLLNRIALIESLKFTD